MNNGWKRRLIFTLVGLAALPKIALAWVYEFPLEFVSAGDFDGDAKTDVVIVDKASGSYRIGYQASVGQLSWSEARVSGVSNVTAVGVGPSLVLGRDALLMSTRSEARIVAADVPDSSTATIQNVYPIGSGVCANVSIPINNATSIPSGVFVATCSNTYPNVGGYSYLEYDGTNLVPTTYSSYSTPVFRNGNRVDLYSGYPQMVVGISTYPDDATVLFGYNVTNNTGIVQASMVLNHSLKSPEYEVLLGKFLGGNLYSHMVSFIPGTKTVYSGRINNSGPYSYSVQDYGSSSVRTNLVQIMEADGLGFTNNLILVFTDGTADLCTFLSYTSPHQSFVAQTGAVIRAVIPIAEDILYVLNASSDAQPIGYFDRYAYSGTSYVHTASGTFEAEIPESDGYANVLLFDKEPFVADSPRKLAGWRAADWSDSLSVTQLPAAVQASCSDDTGINYGLSSAVATNFGAAPSNALFGLVNQYRTDISIMSFDAARGTDVAEVSADPQGGVFNGYVLASLSANPAEASIYYRTDSNAAWVAYTDALPIFKDTTLEYYAVNGSFRSVTYTEVYQFTDDPDDMDSDGDHIPDYVELANGLDPDGGIDQDEDGLTDLEELYRGTDPVSADGDGDNWDDLSELRAGTNPNDYFSHPADDYVVTNDIPRINMNSTLAVQIIPWAVSPNAYSNYSVYCSNRSSFSSGVAISAYGLEGDLQASVKTSYKSSRSASFESLPADELLPFTLFTTPQFYEIADYPTHPAGREMVKLYPQPSLAGISVPYTNNGGNYVVEASNWVSAARSSLSTNKTESDSLEMEFTDTLNALLFEHKIGDLLVNNGTIASNHITLFPYRAADSLRYHPARDELLALQSSSSTSQSVYRLDAIFSDIVTATAQTKNTNIVLLKQVCLEVFGLSASSASTNLYAGQPMDALRQFIAGRGLPTGYVTRIHMQSLDLLNAYSGVQSVLSGISSRSIETLDLLVTTQSYAQAAFILSESNGTDWVLYRDMFTPYAPPGAFKLLDGTELRVSGYTDLGSLAGSGRIVEVVAMSVRSLPVNSPTPTATPTTTPTPTVTPTATPTPTVTPTSSPSGGKNTSWLLLLLNE